MSLKVNTTLSIQSDSDNTYPNKLEVTRYGDTLELSMDMRTIKVSYDQMKQAMRVFAQTEVEEEQ